MATSDAPLDRSAGAPATPASRVGLLAPFRYTTWRRLWSAGFVSQLGDWMQIFARAALAYRLTGRPSSVGWIYFSSYLPQMLFSLWGGVLADRFDRRRLLLGCQVAQLFGAVALGVLVSTETATLFNISALSFVLGIAFMLAIPAGQALAPAVVPREVLSSAISLGTATNSMSRVLGPVLAAALARQLGLEWIFWINAASFLAVIAAWSMTRLPPQPRIGSDVRDRDALREAARYVRGNPRVWVPITVCTLLASVGVVYQPLAIPYATRVLSDGAVGLGQDRAGWLQAAIGVGAAIGILGLANIGRRRPGPVLMASGIAFAVMLIALGQTTSFPIAVAVCVFMGAMQFTNMTLAINLVQHDVPEVMRGRVMSIQMMGLIGFIPITSLAGGVIADHLGIGALFTGAGTLCLAFSVWALRWQHHVGTDPIAPESPETLAAVGAVLEEEG